MIVSMRCTFSLLASEVSGWTQTACICLFTTSTWNGWCGRKCMNHLLGSMHSPQYFMVRLRERTGWLAPGSAVPLVTGWCEAHLFPSLRFSAFSSTAEDDRWDAHQGFYRLWNSITLWGSNKGAVGVDFYTSAGACKGEMNVLVPL